MFLRFSLDVFGKIKQERRDTMSAIVWLGNDLRTHDHEPLYHALKNHDQVFAVCNVATLDQVSAFGYEKMAHPRRKFLYDTLCDLKDSLKTLNVPLMVSKKPPKDLIIYLMDTYEVEAIYYYKEVGSEEAKRYELLRKYGPKNQFSYFGKTLIHPSDLPFKIEALPPTFTQFRKNVESHLRIRKTLPTLSPLKEKAFLFKNDEKWPSFRIDNQKTLPFKGGEKEGLKRLNDYLHKRHIDHYKMTRNNMLDKNASTKFSMYLAIGALSVRYVYENIQAYETNVNKNASTYFVIFELLWRDFFTFVHLKYGNAIFKPGGLMQRNIPWNDNKTYEKAWQEGKTGYPLIDASMKELTTTGFTSNRARQNVASFFTKNLGLDWRKGAQWYESWLIDHDVSSNYGNWNYIAGIGNDQRDFRYFNVNTQGKRYDPSAEFAKVYLKSLEKVDGSIVYDLPLMNQTFSQTIAPNYIEPIVDFDESIKNRKKILGH